MDKNQFNLAEGPNQSIQYLRIPIYQRPYSWGNEQIVKLVTDFQEAFAASEKGNSGTYYLGTISLVKNEDHITDVLDGQQRLTTLTLLAAWLKWNNNNMIQFNGFDKFLLYRGEPRLEFQTRGNLKDEFKGFVKGEFKSPNNPAFDGHKSYSNFKTAIDIFELYFNNLKFKSNIIPFSNWLANNVVLFTSVVPEKSDKQAEPKPQSLYKYYDAVNTAGKQLEKTDVLKAKLLEIINKDGFDTKEIGEIYIDALNRFKDISRPFGLELKPKKNDSELNENELITLESLLTSGGTGNSGTNKDDPSNTFGHLVKGWDLVVLVWHIFRNSENEGGKWNNISVDNIIVEILDQNESERAKKAFRFIETLHTTRFYLDNLFIRPSDSEIPDIKAKEINNPGKEDNSEEGEEEQELANTPSGNKSLGRRGVRLLQEALNGSTLEKHQWLLPALKYLNQNTADGRPKASVTWDSFFQFMENNERVRANGYFQLENTSDLKYGDGYVTYYLNMVDYLLAKEDLKANKKQQMKFTQRSSIEHVIAQTTLDANGINTETPEDFVLHNIYNLGLLTSHRNSAYGLKDFERKKDIFNKYKTDIGYYESLRLKEIYETRKEGTDFDHLKETGRKHNDMFQNWLNEAGNS